MGPTTAAKYAGLDWKSLDTAERSIVTAVTRALNRKHQERESALYATRQEYREALPHEEIACAAIKYDDIGVLFLPAPARHHHIMWTRLFIDGESSHPPKANQGFLTTKGRFVDRVEGLKIATARGQIEHKHGNEGELYSEDMWPTPPEARLYSITRLDDD